MRCLPIRKPLSHWLSELRRKQTQDFLTHVTCDLALPKISSSILEKDGTQQSTGNGPVVKTRIQVGSETHGICFPVDGGDGAY
jgi:hypothetical protein